MRDPSASSQRAVVAALCGNAFVALIKLLGFLASGSGAMLSEAIHSLADTGNQLLLLIGLKRSRRTRDDEFHYGYGGERFIFGLLSAAGIFFLGAGVTVYHGIISLVHPSLPNLGRTTFIVLLASALIEGGVLLYALRSVAKERAGMPLLSFLHERADPAALAIILEDSAAVLGLVLASIGIGLSYLTGSPVFDALASIAVGVLLAAVAVYLVLENRGLLLGRAVPEDVEARFEQILRNWPGVKGVRDIKTRELTPESYVLKAEIALDERLLAEAFDDLVPRIPGMTPSARELLLRAIAERAILRIAVEIDRMEGAVRAAIPQARHIDLEVDRPASASVSTEAYLP